MPTKILLHYYNWHYSSWKSMVSSVVLFDISKFSLEDQVMIWCNHPFWLVFGSDQTRDWPVQNLTPFVLMSCAAHPKWNRLDFNWVAQRIHRANHFSLLWIDYDIVGDFEWGCLIDWQLSLNMCYDGQKVSDSKLLVQISPMTIAWGSFILKKYNCGI